MFYHQQHSASYSRHQQHSKQEQQQHGMDSDREEDNSITLYISYSDLLTTNGSGDGNTNVEKEHLFNIDIYSTIINAYLVFSNIKYKIKIMEPSCILSSIYGNHVSSNDIHFPILVHSYNENNVVIYGMNEILNYLKSKGENLDSNLTLNENTSTSLQQIQTEIEAFINIVHEKCLPFYLNYFWNREDIFKSYTKGLYFSNMNVIARWIHTYSDRNKHVQLFKNLISNKTFKNLDEETMNYLGITSHDEKISVKLFMECLDSLNMLLGSDNKYFYGHNPSTLDTIVYGYLSTIYHTTLSILKSNQQLSDNNQIVIKIFNRYPNLKRWLSTIHDEYIYESNQYFIQHQSSLSTKQYDSLSMVNNITPIQNQHLNNNNSKPRSSHQLAPVLPNKRKYLTFVVVSIIGYLFYILRNVRIQVEKPPSNYPKQEIYYYDNQYELKK